MPTHPRHTPDNKLISIISPAFNEEKNISLFAAEIEKVFEQLPYEYEILFVNDGSVDNTRSEIEKLALERPHIHLLDFSRNFGKEVATTAGLNHASGDAALLIDVDLQHPVECIPEFIRKWEEGADVVVGVRNNNKSDGHFKKIGSKLFYKIMSAISEVKLVPQSTDYRLIDRVVIDEFNKLTERNRITRGLIDWLGFNHDYVYFDANDRLHGEASYSKIKLIKLALASFISLSLLPLRLAGYLGALITLSSGVLGAILFIDRYLYSFRLGFSGTAILAVILLFLIGVVLMSLGLLAFYIGHIFHETQNRPLYVLRNQRH